MKKFVLLAAAASAVAIGSPAAAEPASGTVDLIGTVAPKCTAADFTDSINLGELAKVDGTVDATFPNANDPSRSFTIRCTAPNVRIGVVADALTEASDPTTGGGYTGTVHYTATVDADGAAGGSATAAYATLTGGGTEVTDDLGERLANAANNITVTVSNGVTSNTGDLLKSGDYTGQIRVTVSPI